MLLIKLARFISVIHIHITVGAFQYFQIKLFLR